MEVSSGTIHDNPWLGVPSSSSSPQSPKVQSTMTSRQRGIQRRGGGRNINNNDDETEEQRRRRQHFTCTDWTLHTLVQAFLGIDIGGCLFWLIYGLILVFYLHHSDKHNNNNNNHHNDNEKNNNHTNTLLVDSDYNNNNNNHHATLMIYDSYNSEYYADAEWMTTGSINNNNGSGSSSSGGSSSYHHWPAALALEWSLWLGVRVLCVTAALYYSQIVNLCGLLVASYISIVLSIQHLLLSSLSAIYRHDLHHLNWWHSHYLLFGGNDDDSHDDKNVKNGLIVWFFETWEPWLWLIFLILAIVECPIRYGVYQQYRQRLLQQEEDDLQQTAFISRASTHDDHGGGPRRHPLLDNNNNKEEEEEYIQQQNWINCDNLSWQQQQRQWTMVMNIIMICYKMPLKLVVVEVVVLVMDVRHWTHMTTITIRNMECPIGSKKKMITIINI